MLVNQFKTEGEQDKHSGPTSAAPSSSAFVLKTSDMARRMFVQELTGSS